MGVRHRETKELLLTGDSLDADDDHRLGLVSKVFPRAELSERTLAFARRIAELSSIASFLSRSR